MSEVRDNGLFWQGIAARYIPYSDMPKLYIFKSCNDAIFSAISTFEVMLFLPFYFWMYLLYFVVSSISITLEDSFFYNKAFICELT